MSLSHHWIYARVAFIAFLVGILCCIYVQLYVVSEKTCQDCPQEQLSSSTKAKSSSCRRMCTSKDCVLTAAEVISSVNEKHSDPCVDFHSYSCGNLPPQIPDNKGEIPLAVEEAFLVDLRNVINEISDKEMQPVQQLKKMYDPCVDFHSHSCGNMPPQIPDNKDEIPLAVEEAFLVDLRNVINEISDKEIQPVQQLKKMYDNCVNFESSEERVVPALLKVLSKAGLSGWPHLPKNWTFQTGDGRKVSLDFVLSQLELLKSYNFLELYYDGDQAMTHKSNTRRTVVDVNIRVSPMVVLDEEYLNPTKYQKQLLLHEEMLYKIFDVLDVSENETHAHVADIFLLEENIVFWLDQRHSNSRTFNLEYKALSTSEWKEFVRLQLQESGIPLNDLDVRILSHTKSFRSMIMAHSDRQIGNYLAYRFVLGKLEGLGFFFRGFFPNLVRTRDFAMKGVGMPKWKECVVKISFFLKPLLSYWYMLRRLDKNDRSNVEDLYHSIHQVTHNIIDEITWLDETSKRDLKKAIRSTKSPVDNFATYANTSFIENLYADMEFRDDSYFGNYMEFRMFGSRYLTKDDLSERKMWLFIEKGYFKPNAKLSHEGELIFGFSLIRFPLYSLSRLKRFNIAMFGAFLAHELVHVIQHYLDEDEFRDYDIHGQPEAVMEFRDCVTKHYGSYKFQYIDRRLPSKKSFREDFADLVGAEITYRAYKQAIEENGGKFMVQGLNMTEDRLFFVLFAHYFCQPMNENFEKKILRRPITHSPNKFRTSGIASNLRQFAKAFQCPDNSPMNPKEKCILIH